MLLRTWVVALVASSLGAAAGHRPLPAGGGNVTIGLLLPKTMFGGRAYNKAINEAIKDLHKLKGKKLTFLSKFTFGNQQVNSHMMELTPTPTGKMMMMK
ncbi:glutamate receptor, ionotropic, n-methyl d-aspartate epsilon [Nesidiocoris tenuis]|uniref:Glutamate receptor, ionotropic, n-methyl d-aspartate epsilon n=1 Tax=Nesidiocoris tenuis TaxID=355587 RepID=A0ABN7BI03_9HEMI|nr:glutamate receptor, ionotropic, n-methyl d-aspartate epsilon [Nesidiocoris tenuis]